MKTYVCQVCRHIAFQEAPVDCPVCKMPIENYERDPDAIRKPADEQALTEEEAMHLPVLEINRDCSLLPGRGCRDVTISIGQDPHVMESEHFITFIDLYINRQYLNRILFTSRRMYPAATLHLSLESGTLAVIASCNVHGNWMASADLE